MSKSFLNIFTNNEWMEKHLNNIKNRAGLRYTPKLDVELPIAELFEVISRRQYMPQHKQMLTVDPLEACGLFSQLYCHSYLTVGMRFALFVQSLRDSHICKPKYEISTCALLCQIWQN